MSFNKKKGFTLAEALIFLLVTALVMAATMPIVTRKHLRPGQKVPHGKWACKYINGVKMHATAGSANAKLPADEHWLPGCDFPELPENVKYVVVRVIGAGASGSAGSIRIAQKEDRSPIASSFEAEHHTYRGPISSNDLYASDPFIVPSTGTYTIRFEAAKGSSAILTPSTLKATFGYGEFYECKFPEAPPSDLLPYVEFDYQLYYNDVLTIKEDCSEGEIKQKFNGKAENKLLCDPNKGYEIEVAGEKHDFHFKEVAHGYGHNGCTRTLYLNRGDDSTKLATIKGGAGAYYDSIIDDDNTCDLKCFNRYSPQTDRHDMYANPASMVTMHVTPIGSAVPGLGYPKGSSIVSKSPTIEAYGGCGGAAGQANTVLMLTPKPGELPTVRLGRADATDDFSRSTSFGEIIASGALPKECSSQGVSNTLSGRTGASASDNDSIGGSGGKGGFNKNTLLKDALDSSIFDLIKIGASFADQVKYNACILLSKNQTAASHCNEKSVSVYGTKALGIGAGGGGGGVILALDVQDKSEQETLLDFISSDSFLDYPDISFVGEGGEGSSGGIVVSW